MPAFRALSVLLRAVCASAPGLAIVAPILALAEDEPPDVDVDWTAGGIRIEYDNDLLVNSDDKFTNGFSLQWHSHAREGWDGIRAPGWTKFGRHLPGMQSASLYKRVGLAIGQNMQTPTDLSATELIVEDVPYAGSLGFEVNWIAFDDDVFRGYALIVGVVGSWSGAEQTQKWIHELIGGDEPMGWDNQIPDELAVNFNGMFKKKVFTVEASGPFSADLALNADFGLGTALTFGEVAAEFRAGWNVPVGFAFVPDPIGRTIAYDATIPQQRERTSVYFSAVHRETYMQHFVFLDGSLWRNTHGVGYDKRQRQTIVGLHVTRHRWGVHVSYWDSSANVQTELAGSGNDFGTIAFEWRF